ncbi:VOC family protein [Microbacterium pygmaeum]|uniref:Predicted lactoylglutathione lyase n=1 Tax=Microbacterium pygmaeum TaxID=370764 RepID=A0A1G8BKA3_9MICO|nr:glyoxalase [Microbacterium pygmaeum]SDH33568.1 Predicted lactoylglutathione lyase [Microbacterium pygmaeum]
MHTIEFVTIEVDDVAEAEAFYAAAFDVSDRVRVRGAQEPSSGFRQFTLSLVVSQPATVRNVIDSATVAGATVLKSPAKSLWGYGGIVQAPDGTIWTVASSSKKVAGPATREIDEFVLQLGVTDVTASRQFYADRGFTVSKSYGRKYVELETGTVALTLNNRAALAKTAGIPADGNGSHRLSIGSTAGDFADPDGFIWKAPAG